MVTASSGWCRFSPLTPWPPQISPVLTASVCAAAEGQIKPTFVQTRHRRWFTCSSVPLETCFQESKVKDVKIYTNISSIHLGLVLFSDFRRILAMLYVWWNASYDYLLSPDSCVQKTNAIFLMPCAKDLITCHGSHLLTLVLICQWKVRVFVTSTHFFLECSLRGSDWAERECFLLPERKEWGCHLAWTSVWWPGWRCVRERAACSMVLLLTGSKLRNIENLFLASNLFLPI